MYTPPPLYQRVPSDARRSILSFLMLTLAVFMAVRPTSAQCSSDPGFSPAVTVPSGGALASLYGTGFFSTTVLLEGDLTVNSNFTIDASVLRLKTGVEILVQAGYTLTIDNSTLTDCVGVMWSSIRVEPTGHLIIRNNSLVENAEVAVTSEGTAAGTFGNFTIRNSRLLNNYIGVDVQATSGTPHAGTVEKVEISGSVLIAPYAGQTGFAGMRIEGVSNGITVGNTAGSIGTSSDFNHFHDLEFGVYAREGIINLQNNLFEAIQPGVASGGVAIYLEGSLTTNMIATVGAPAPGVGGPHNRTLDCQNGVVAYKVNQVFIEENEFIGNLVGGTTPTMKQGVLLQQTGAFGNGTALVTGNRIEEFLNFGVRARLCNGVVEIADNAIENILIDKNLDFDVTGIQVQNFATNVTQIVRNDIDFVMRGIVLANADAAEVVANNVDFFFPGMSTKAVVGIYAEGSDFILVDSNTVNGACTGCTNLDIHGIEMKACDDFEIDKNDVADCGIGIIAEDQCPNGNFTCNRIDGSRYGFGLKDLGDPAVIGPVGTVSGATFGAAGNAWEPHATANRTYTCCNMLPGTTGSTIQWYYNPAFSNWNMPATTNTTSGFPSDPVVPLLDSGVPCGAIPISESGFSSSPAIRHERFEQIAEILKATTSNSCEHYNLRHYVFEYFNNYPEELVLGDVSDAAVANLYAVSYTNAFAAFRKIDSALAANELLQASSLNNAVSPLCLPDNWQKRVVNIYLNGLDSVLDYQGLIGDELPYSNIEMAMLNALAGKDGEQGDMPVYAARALLGSIGSVSWPVAAVLKTHTDEKSSKSLSIVNPIPIHGACTLLVPELLNGSINIDLIDMQGRVAWTLELGDSESTIELNLPTLVPGSYVLNLEDQHGLSVSQLVVVQ